jgi:hypothetical protein
MNKKRCSRKVSPGVRGPAAELSNNLLTSEGYLARLGETLMSLTSTLKLDQDRDQDDGF